MGKYEKLYQAVLMRQSDMNVPFDGLCVLLERLGFEKRIKGDHHIFSAAEVEEIVKEADRIAQVNASIPVDVALELCRRVALDKPEPTAEEKSGGDAEGGAGNPAARPRNHAFPSHGEPSPSPAAS